MANLSEVFIAALRLAAALFGTNKAAASGSQAPEPSQGAAPASSKGTASHGVGTSQSAGTSQDAKPTPRSVANAKTAAKSTASRDVHISGNQVWDVATRGLPEFSYQPVADNDADPGEVVWTWISYEEDPTQGKDRPVVVLARTGSDVVVAQLTSKNTILTASRKPTGDVTGWLLGLVTGIRKGESARCAWTDYCLSPSVTCAARGPCWIGPPTIRWLRP